VSTLPEKQRTRIYCSIAPVVPGNRLLAKYAAASRFHFKLAKCRLLGLQNSCNRSETLRTDAGERIGEVIHPDSADTEFDDAVDEHYLLWQQVCKSVFLRSASPMSLPFHWLVYTGMPTACLVQNVRLNQCRVSTSKARRGASPGR